MNTRTRILSGRIEPSFMAATSAWLRDLVAEFGIGKEDEYRIDLCFEELVMNTISYAAPEHQGLEFDIEAAISAQRISIELIDAAQPYDPLAEHKPLAISPDTDLTNIKIGGHGVTLVKEYSDECSYRHVDGKNHLLLVFNLAEALQISDVLVQPPRGTDRRKSARAPNPSANGDDSPVVVIERRKNNDRRAQGFLSRSDVFRDVPVALIEGLMEHHPIQRFACEMLLLRPGDQNHKVYIILSGNLKVEVGSQNRGESFAIPVGGCVGEMSVIDNKPASAFITANSETRLLVVDGDAFVREFLAQPIISRNLLSALAERLRRHNDLVLKRVRLEVQMEQMQRELSVAKEIQESLLPHAPLFPGDARLDCVGRMIAAREVGGDFYDIFELDADNLFFVIGDVCGKGLPAALFMVRAISALRAQSSGSFQEEGYLANLVASLNRQLCSNNDKQQFLTAFCGILNVATGHLQFLNAGHNAPLITGADGQFMYLEQPINPIVGMIEDLSYRSGSITLPPDGTLFLYTDGVTEAETHDSSMYGEERLQACLNGSTQRGAHDYLTLAFTAVEKFVAGAEQSDDITVLAITRHLS